MSSRFAYHHTRLIDNGQGSRPPLPLIEAALKSPFACAPMLPFHRPGALWISALSGYFSFSQVYRFSTIYPHRGGLSRPWAATRAQKESPGHIRSPPHHRITQRELCPSPPALRAPPRRARPLPPRSLTRSRHRRRSLPLPSF